MDLISQDFTFYIVAIVVLVLMLFVFKKIASCLVKSVIGLVVLAVLAYIWYMYFR